MRANFNEVGKRKSVDFTSSLSVLGPKISRFPINQFKPVTYVV